MGPGRHVPTRVQALGAGPSLRPPSNLAKVHRRPKGRSISTSGPVFHKVWFMIGNSSPLAAGHHHPAPWRSRVPPARTPRAGYGQRRRTGSGPCGSGPPRPHTRAASAAVRSDVRKAEAGPVYNYIWFMIYLHSKASRLDLHRQRSTAVRYHGSRVNHVSRAYRPGPPGRIYGQRCCKQCIGSGLGPCGSGPPRPHTRAASAAVRSDMRRPSPRLSELPGP
jgi:hypothetical protein